MQATGILMMLLFLYLYFAPWRRFSRAVETGVLQDAAASLNQIRRIVATNLVLGLVTGRRLIRLLLARSGKIFFYP